MTALDVALRGSWGLWHGLEPDLTAAELIRRFGAPLVRARPAGGRFGVAVDLPPPAPLTRLRAWDRDGTVGLVQLDDPPAPDGIEAALAAPGRPELVRPARYVRYGLETEEHVYPWRGLTLVTGHPYDHGLDEGPAGTAPMLVHAELFVPCSIDAWQERWGGLEPARPDPH